MTLLALLKSALSFIKFRCSFRWDLYPFQLFENRSSVPTVTVSCNKTNYRNILFFFLICIDMIKRQKCGLDDNWKFIARVNFTWISHFLLTIRQWKQYFKIKHSGDCNWGKWNACVQFLCTVQITCHHCRKLYC